MYNTTAQYKEYIKKPSRDFECRVKIGNRTFTNTEVIKIVPETVQPNDGFSIGNTVSQSIDITLKNDGGVYASAGIVDVAIGLKVGNKIEYVPIGVFNIDDVEKTDYTVKLTCYDNMIKFETGYFEKYENPTLWQVIKQLEKTTGVQFDGIVPSYTVTKLSGYTCREILAYVASICGGNAFITRDGKFTIKAPMQVDYKITAANYFNTGYTSEDSIYKIGMITCKNKTNTDYTENEDYDSANDKNTISVGSLSSDTMELTFENPWVTENILNDIYSKLKDFSYLGYSMKWQGDMSLDVGDIVTVVDKNNVTRKAFIYANKLNYTGGLTAETSAKGETKNSNSFNASGKNISEIDRIAIKLLIAEQAIINKANIKDLQATNANISNLHATVADIATLVSGNLTSNNIHSLILTSDKVTVENGFIKNAMIESLAADKITAGTLSTNKLTISSNNGGLVLANNTMQFSDKDKNVRVQIGQDAKGDFNFIVKGIDGKTVLIDSSGLHEGAISDGLIKTDMIADNAINANKINYESVISGLNTDGSTYINASKVAIDLNGQTLDIAFNSVTNNINTNTTAISTMQGKISTLISNTTVMVDGKEKTLKDAYNGTVATVNSLKTTIGEHTSTINTLDGTVKSNTSKITTIQADLNNISATLSSTQSTVKTQATQISNITTTVTNTTSRVASLELTTNGLNTKIEETETILTNLSIGGRNLAQKTSNKYSNSFSSFNGGINKFPSLAKVLTDGLSVGDTVTVRLVYKYTNIVATSGQIAKCWIQGSGNTTGWSSGAFASSKTLTLSGSGEYEFLYNFKITANHLKNNYWDVTIRHDYVQSGSVQWKMFKVEKGTKATDWTPALEDVDSSIVSVKDYTTKTVSSLSSNLNGITARTETLESKTTNLESTVKSNVSEISTLKGKISLKVEQTDINKAISNMQSSINLQLDSITSKVNQSVSSRNLINNSALKNPLGRYYGSNGGATHTRIVNKSEFNGWHYVNPPVCDNAIHIRYDKSGDNYVEFYDLLAKVKPNTKYTISYYYSIDSPAGSSNFNASSSFIYYRKADGSGLPEPNFAIDINFSEYTGRNRWARYVKTFITPNVYELDNLILRFGFWQSTNNFLEMLVTGIQLEEGDLTEWTEGVYSSVGTIITQSPTQIAIAIKNQTNNQAIFDSNGLTIENGGLKINKNGKTSLRIENSGYVISSYGYKITSNVTSKFTNDGLFFQTQSLNGTIFEHYLAGVYSGVETDESFYIGKDAYIKRDADVKADLWVGGDLQVEGRKHCMINTDNYGKRLINAYETAEYYFGDIGRAILDNNGECVIYIDDIFGECVNTQIQYEVFTSVYRGKLDENESIIMNDNYFILKGKPNSLIGWEIKAKRKGWENVRLEERFEYNDFVDELYEFNLINDRTVSDEVEDILFDEEV